MDEVKAWLNGPRDYASGVKLYLQHGYDKVLRSLFTKEAETPFKRDRLVKALQDLYKNHKHPTSKKAAMQRILQNQNPAENFKYWPPHPIQDKVVLALWEQWKPVYAEMMNLQARLHDIAVLGEKDGSKAQEACDMVHRILDLDDRCDEIYAQRDYYYQHGAMPSLVIDEPVAGDPIVWATRLKSYERYVRDYRAKLAKDEKNVKYAVKMQKYQEEVVKYRKLLKLD